MPTPKRFQLSGDEVAALVRVGSAIDHIQGWLAPREAWELHELAREAAERTNGSALVVEIGSWRGRSTVAIALGLKAGGGGRLITIDPQIDSEERHQEVLSNLQKHGVADLAEVVRDYSQNVRHLVEDGTVDVLFIDGNHDYPAVSRDLQMWGPSVRSGGELALNDPYWPGVRRTIREQFAVRESPYRRPRLIVNTMFAEHTPGAPWTQEDQRLMDELRSLLRFLRPWRWFHERLKARWPTHRVTWRVAQFGGRAIKRRYSLTDLAHYEWALNPRNVSDNESAS